MDILIPLQVSIVVLCVLGCVAMHVCGVNLTEPVRGDKACYIVCACGLETWSDLWSHAGFISTCHSPLAHQTATPPTSRPQTSYYSPVSETKATYLQCSQWVERYKGSGESCCWLTKIDFSMH